MKTFLNGVHSIQNALEHDASNITQLWVAENKRNPRIDKLLAQAEKLGLTLNKGNRYRLNKEQEKELFNMDQEPIKRLFFDKIHIIFSVSCQR